MVSLFSLPSPLSLHHPQQSHRAVCALSREELSLMVGARLQPPARPLIGTKQQTPLQWICRLALLWRACAPRYVSNTDGVAVGTSCRTDARHKKSFCVGVGVSGGSLSCSGCPCRQPARQTAFVGFAGHSDRQRGSRRGRGTRSGLRMSRTCVEKLRRNVVLTTAAWPSCQTAGKTETKRAGGRPSLYVIPISVRSGAGSIHGRHVVGCHVREHETRSRSMSFFTQFTACFASD